MGEVRAGYKVTDLGEIPHTWDILNVDNITNKIIGGGTPSRENEDFYKGEIPWVTVKDMKGDFYQEDAQEYINDDALKNSAANLIEPNNVIIATRIALGRGFINTKEIAINQDLKALYLEKRKVTNEYFLYWYLNNAELVKGMGSGSTVKGIRIEQLKKIQLPVPTLQEQQKIATILSTVDDQIDETEQLIVKTKELKKGLMQQLLTKGIGHTEFKQTELGEIPVEWDISCIKDLFLVKSGLTPLRANEKYFTHGKIPWVKTLDLNNKSIDKTQEYITKLALNETSIKMIPKNTVLIAMYGGFNQIGRTGLLKIDATTNQAISALIPLDEKSMNADFLQMYLNANVEKWKNYAASSRKDPNITKGDVENFLLVIPPLHEQQKIAQILSTVDEQIEAYEQEKAKYDELKKGLMQQLLTGQIRVKI